MICLNEKWRASFDEALRLFLKEDVDRMDAANSTIIFSIPIEER